MTNEVFMGIDIGTTSVKAAAFDGRGRRLGLFTEDYAGPTCVLVSGDTTIENMEYTIRLIYTGSAE